MVCDITVQRLLRLENAMAQCQASMPPMRGCLQTSMILEVGALWKYNGSMLGARNKHGRQDLMLSTTDHTRFLKVIKSKVQGTINVVSALSPIKSKLELFVMLSSSCSPHHALLIMLSSSLGIIGNRGQVNYAAASTFLDVFAAQLVTRGYLPGHLYQSGQRAQGRARSRRTSIRCRWRLPTGRFRRSFCSLS
ncbi:hypothetical protein M752DRAFT_105044 [Aspergillus phoenicis ATCC 13157]|uniref:Ketoreductase (KR) domain-containing protein n=1 Tax=Aspergillus phoenicis ATCC 13157 TaxID=1353007 RepID=A0A370P5D9_ASPPH|nr:hypothetical protein M752DRAFT_105044 [Aspergillus phoenicis ATCC 13157]